MASLIRRMRRRLLDEVKYSALSRELMGWMWLLRGSMTRERVARGTKLARALGFAMSQRLRAICITKIKSCPGIDGASEVWTEVARQNARYFSIIQKQPKLERSIILKAPGAHGEKGVLLMTFEYNWARLLLGMNDDELGWLEERFDLIFSTSSSPTAYAILLLAVSRIRGTVFVQVCNPRDAAVVESIHPRLKCLPTMPCDWINPDLFDPKPNAERQTDVLMVSNWADVKRHFDLFRALAPLSKDLRIVLIGQPEDGVTSEDIRSMAREYGVPQELVIFESLPIHEVARHQCDARVSVIMSRREGCCVAAVESLFAGSALALRADAHIGPLSYINEQTGRLLRPSHLAEDLAALVNDSGKLAPRTWAIENIAGLCSQKKVDDMLAKHAAATRAPWTRGIVLPQWRPHPTFACADDLEAMCPVYTELHERFPQVFSENLITESWR